MTVAAIAAGSSDGLAQSATVFSLRLVVVGCVKPGSPCVAAQYASVD